MPRETQLKLRTFCPCPLARPLRRLFWRYIERRLVVQHGLAGNLMPSMHLEQDLLSGGIVHDGKWTELLATGEVVAIKGRCRTDLGLGKWHVDMAARQDPQARMPSSTPRFCLTGIAHATSLAMLAVPTRACPCLCRCRSPCRWRAGEPQRYTHDGLVLRGGGFLEADVVVYATGGYLGPGCSTLSAPRAPT